MQIVAKSNFDDESYAEWIIIPYIHEFIGKIYVKALQDQIKDNSRHWPVLKPDDYVLWRGIEEFM